MNVVSVIVPIYQANKYIGKCIQSILNQSYSKLEIILVDDGSTDGSYEICATYAEKDSRIILVHTDNHGGAHARNIGLKLATGKYISFVDADDYLEEDFIRVMVCNIEQFGADIVETAYYYVEEEKKEEKEILKSYINELDAVQAMKMHIEDRICRQIVWNKLYKRVLVRDILFVEDKTIDDEFWTYQVIGKATKIIHISQPLYNYVRHDSSIMHKRYNLKRLQALEAQQLRLKFIRENYVELVSCAEYMMYFACMYHMQMSLKYLDDIRTPSRIIAEIVKKEFPNISFIRGLSIEKKMWVILSRISFITVCRIRNVLKIGV